MSNTKNKITNKTNPQSTLTQIQQSQLSQFEKYLLEESKATNTIKSYIADLVLFFSYLSSNNISSLTLTRDTILSYKKYLNESNNSPKTFNRKITSLKKYNEYLVYSKQQLSMIIIKKDFIKIQKQTTSPTTIEPEYIDKFIQRVKDNASMRDYTMTVLLANTGMRISEVCNLKLSDIDLESRTIKVIGKGNKYREINISSSIIPILKKYLSERSYTSTYAEASPYVFVSRQSEKVSTVTLSKIYRDLQTKRQKVTAHKFRHNYASYIVENQDKIGMSLKGLQETLGHSSLTTTQQYTHVRKTELQKQQDRICIGI